MGSACTKDCSTQPQARLKEALLYIEHVMVLQEAYTAPIAQPVRARSQKAKSLVSIAEGGATPNPVKGKKVSKSVDIAPASGSGATTQVHCDARGASGASDAPLSDAAGVEFAGLSPIKLPASSEAPHMNASDSYRIRRGSFQVARGTGTPYAAGAAIPSTEAAARGSKVYADSQGPLCQKTLMEALDVCAARTVDRSVRTSFLRMIDREKYSRQTDA